jgi:predicted dehydrogenase
MQTGYPFSFDIRIMGSRATVEYSYSAGATIADRPSGKTELKLWRQGQGKTAVALNAYDAYERQLRYFLDCVENNRKPEIITPEQSREVIAMIDALHRSADGKKIVYL